MEPKFSIGKNSNKRARSATRRGTGGRAKTEVTIKDDVKELNTKDEAGRRVAVGGGKSKGEKSAPKKGKLGSVDEVQKGDHVPSEKNLKTPTKRKRGADGEMVLAFLSSAERSSSRLRPRKDVPTFRKVELAEDDSERIIGKRVKIYWSGSRRWFVGHVKAFDRDKRCHKIHYDDGEKEDLDLRKERFELEVFPGDGFNLAVEPKPEKKVKEDGAEDSEENNKESSKKAVGGKRVKVKVGNAKPMKSPMKSKKKRTARAKKVNKLILKRKEETKEEVNLSESVEVHVQHDEIKKDAVESEIITEKSADVNYPENDKVESPVKNARGKHGEVSVESTKNNSDIKKDESCLDDGKIGVEAGDDGEKKSETEKKMELKDSTPKESSAQDVKDNTGDVTMVEAPVQPAEVVEKVISGETNMDGPGDANFEKNVDDFPGKGDVIVDMQVSQSKEVSGSSGDMPKDDSIDDAKILKTQPTENDLKFKQSEYFFPFYPGELYTCVITSLSYWLLGI